MPTSAANLKINVRASSFVGLPGATVSTLFPYTTLFRSVSTPTDSDSATANAVDENAAVGTHVGVTAHAFDGDATTNAVSYSLTDSAGGKFEIGRAHV